MDKLNTKAQELINKKQSLVEEKDSINVQQGGSGLSQEREHLRVMQDRGRHLRESLLAASTQRKTLNDDVVEERRLVLAGGESLQQLVLKVDRLRSEMATLEKVIGGGGDEQDSTSDRDHSMVGQIQIDPGYERAVSAALGADLAASTPRGRRGRGCQIDLDGADPRAATAGRPWRRRAGGAAATPRPQAGVGNRVIARIPD